MAFKILLCGHSFIKRFNNFISEHRRDYSYSLNLVPYDIMVHCSGKLGGKVHDLWGVEDINDFEPDIVVLQCGSNDLCDQHMTPEMLCTNIIQFVNYLVK